VSDGIGAWPRGAVALELGDATFHREIGLVERARRLRADEPDAATRLAGCIVEAAGRGAAKTPVGRARRRNPGRGIA
jgi:hypothetical protein